MSQGRKTSKKVTRHKDKHSVMKDTKIHVNVNTKHAQTKTVNSRLDNKNNSLVVLHGNKKLYHLAPRDSAHVKVGQKISYSLKNQPKTASSVLPPI